MLNYPPASKASREVANLTERKNPQTPVYGVKEFVSLSVCPSVILFALTQWYGCLNHTPIFHASPLFLYLFHNKSASLRY